MKNRKGFTLVELLAVIVIIGIVAVIIASSLARTSNDAKTKMLETKRKNAGQSFILWAQDNMSCFNTDATNNPNCFVGVNKSCDNFGDNNEYLKCSSSYKTLADNGLIKYDDEEKQEVTNPVTNESMNNLEILLYYNRQSRKFSVDTPVSTVVTTKKIFDVPEITIDPEQNTNWAKLHEVAITINGGTSGLGAGGTMKFGWSTSNSSKPTTYSNASLNYTPGDASTTFMAYSDSLTGKYYIWVEPNMTNVDGITITGKISSGTYWFDNTPPGNVSMNFVYGDWAQYHGEWTNRNIYAARSESANAPTGGSDAHSGFGKYQISKDGTNWVDYAYNNTNDLYKITAEGDTTRYFRACDKVGNCGLNTTVTCHIDKTKPVINNFSGTTKVLTINVSDERSGIASYCIATQNSSTNCTWTNYTGSNPLNGTISLTNSQPGKTIYAFVKDKAGNVSSSRSLNTSCQEIIYQDGTSCTKVCGGGTRNRLAYDKYVTTTRCSSQDQSSGGSACNTMGCCDSVTYQDGTSCSKKCGGGTKNRLAYSAYDGSRCSSKDQTSGGSSCNTQDCCGSVRYENGTTCTKKCGSGTYNRLAYSTYDGSRCSAKDLTSGGSACNTQDCCSSVTYQNGTTCSKKCGGGTYNRLAYSAYDGSRCSSKDSASGGSSCNTQSCCAATEDYSCGSWTWSACTASCGGGTRYQYRTCYVRSAYDHSTVCNSGNAVTRYQSQNSSCNTESCNPCGSNNVLYASGFNCNPVCWYYSMAYCSGNSGYCYYCP